MTIQYLLGYSLEHLDGLNKYKNSLLLTFPLEERGADSAKVGICGEFIKHLSTFCFVCCYREECSDRLAHHNINIWIPKAAGSFQSLCLMLAGQNVEGQ